MAKKGKPPKRQRKLSGGPPKKRKVKRKLSAYNRHVQREMKAGRSMKQAATSWRGGRKSSTKTVRRSTSRRTTPRRTSTKKVRRVGKNGFNTQKIMKYVRLVALGAPALGHAMNPNLNTESKIHRVLKDYTGYNNVYGTFSFGDALKGWTPFLAATVLTHGIPKIAGIIRGL